MIDLDDVIKKVRELARKRRDVVYDSDGACSYARGRCSDGTKGCIFGQVFEALGTPISYEMADRLGAIQNILDDDDEHSARSYLKVRKTSITKKKLDWCSVVQVKQDAHIPWGEAVKYADKVFKI